MNTKHLLLIAASTTLMASAAFAGPSNLGPPPGWFYSLTGQPINSSYVQYTTSFVATGSITNLTFAFREDPAFIYLDDVSLTTGGGPELITNGGFEAGPVGSNAPTGWQYLNVYGATFGGVVATNNPHSGSNNYYDGAVQAYDAINQYLHTTAGATYTLSFWEADDSGSAGVYQPLSTNGDVTDTNGNGIDLFVYEAGHTPAVPEPATWALMLAGVGLLGATLRGRKAKLA